MSLQELRRFDPDSLREFLGEGLSDSECRELLEYASDLQRIEHADFIAREAQAISLSMGDYAEWLAEEIEGADLISEMISEHRRRGMLCLSELQRRERMKRLPKNARFRDFRAEYEELQRNGIAIISTYTELTKRGKEFMGRCIFHDDHTPSLRVNAEHGLWYCFGCGVGGNIRDFIQSAERAGARIAA